MFFTMNTPLSGFVGKIKQNVQRLKYKVTSKMMSSVSRKIKEAKAPPLQITSSFQRGPENILSSPIVGAISFQMMRVGYRLGIFRVLHEKPGLTLSEIAKELELQEYPVEIVMLSLVPLQLLQKIGDRYYNNPMLSGFLSGELFDGGLGKIIEYMHEVINPAFLHLEESVRTNQPVGLHKLFGEESTSFYGDLSKHPEVNHWFESAMRADTQFNREMVVGCQVFQKVKKVLDVGGNTGELAIALGKRYPQMQVSVFDFPEVLKQTQKRFAEEKLTPRLDTYAGNLLNQPFPKGYDCVLFAHFLDIFSRQELQEWIDKAFHALDAGGSVCVFGSVMDDNDEGPLVYGALSAYFFVLAEGKGRFYSVQIFKDVMTKAGFKNITVTKLPKSEAVITAIKP